MKLPDNLLNLYDFMLEQFKHELCHDKAEELHLLLKECVRLLRWSPQDDYEWEQREEDVEAIFGAAQSILEIDDFAEQEKQRALAEHHRALMDLYA